ncbi:MAG: ABC transporter permease [Bacteroidales bacterium]|nr:ABC transporter permease [Bacteroidales bacterium]
MNASRFIAGKLRFKGKIAMVSIAISFLVMILAVSISAGYRKEIREGVSSFSGDIVLGPAGQSYLNSDQPVSANPSYMQQLLDVEGVRSIAPVIYRAGIIKQGTEIHGVVFKGVEMEGESLDASIPSGLAKMMSISQGDAMLTYFVGDNIKARRFNVVSVYDNPLDIEEALIVYVPIEDMRRLNEWDETQVSALEVTLGSAYKSSAMMEEKSAELGNIALLYAQEDEPTMMSTSIVRQFPQLFDWLDLIDFNVLFILLLMAIVAGFNMISGLLIMLFRNISTIGTLKALGMTDKGIAKVFLQVSSNLVLKGMLIGNALALLFCLIQGRTHFFKLNPENYFVSFVPVAVNIPMILLADLAAYIIIMLLLLLPSLFISKVDPAQTMRTQ